MSRYRTPICSTTSRSHEHAEVLRHLGQPSEFRLSRDVADDLLSRADVTDLLAQQLGSGPSCRLAVELAEAIADEADLVGAGNDFDLEKVKEWKSRRGAEDFDIWFADLGDIRSRCFAIALAVLNGLPYDAVARGARALYREFERPPYMVMASAMTRRLRAAAVPCRAASGFTGCGPVSGRSRSEVRTGQPCRGGGVQGPRLRIQGDPARLVGLRGAGHAAGLAGRAGRGWIGAGKDLRRHRAGTAGYLVIRYLSLQRAWHRGRAAADSCATRSPTHCGSSPQIRGCARTCAP